MIFVVVFMFFVIFERMHPSEIYRFGTGTMCAAVAEAVLVADIMLLICYCAIIWIIRVNARNLKESRNSKQTKSQNNTFFLCFGIVSVFVAFSTPFVVVFISNWNSPHWLMKVAVISFPFNHISNSMIFLVHKHRSKRPITVSRDNKEQMLQQRSDKSNASWSKK